MKGGDSFMKNERLIKALGIAATVVGLAATLVTELVSDYQMDKKINDRVKEAIAKHEKEGV